MNTVSLKLVVLRVPDLEQAAAFYSTLGLEFTKHAHGTGPEHYAAEAGEVIFELYPLTKESTPTTGVRIGFQVAQAAMSLAHLVTKGGKIVTPLKDSPWGLRGVIDDPFGHRIELTQTKT